MRYCRIVAGVVFETLEADTAPAAPGLTWQPDPSATAAQGWTWDGTAFAAPVPDVAAARTAAIDTLTRAFNVALDAGFESSALGSAHRYDSEQHNRENLIGAVAVGVSQPYTCDDTLGNADSKQQRTHTASQLLQVLTDGATRKQTLIAHLRTQVAAVEAATTVEAALAVTWAL